MSGKVRFGDYELDYDGMELRMRGVPVRLQEQPLRVLTMLAERPGEIVTREQLRGRIWGETFVDFDHALNKAVNKIREALQDNAGRPRFIETVPRRGYRFIATVVTIPVADSPAVTAAASQLPVLPSPVLPPQTGHARPRKWLIAGWVLAAVFAVMAAAAALWVRPVSPAAVQPPKLLVPFGWRPSLSPDGKLLAYITCPDVSEQNHIWLQQIGGGKAIPITTGKEQEITADFSPDATSVVFQSERGGGGIYTAPTLPGEPRLLIASPNAVNPRFSPDGARILYLQDEEAFTVSASGGARLPLTLNKDFRVYTSPLWSPDGQRVIFYGVHLKEKNGTPAWWVAPITAGEPTRIHLPGLERNVSPNHGALAWIRTSDQQQSIVYSVAEGDDWTLFRIAVSPQGVTDDKPVSFASGHGDLVFPAGSASSDGKFAYQVMYFGSQNFTVPIVEGPQLGAPLQLSPVDRVYHTSPSVSRDGKWMTYDSSYPGDTNSIWLKDLSTGAEHLIDDKGRAPGTAGSTSISPDGSRIVFERDCTNGKWPGDEGGMMPCSFLVAASGGQPAQVCEYCTPRGFSSDGSVLLAQKYDPKDIDRSRIVAVNLRTRTEKDFLSLPDHPVFQPYFSWDDRWLVFKKSGSLHFPKASSQITIAPVRHGSLAPQAEWINVTDGKHDDGKPQFSADGNTVYYVSPRDGYLCIWAQRLDPVTKHPAGPPLAVEHFHNAAGRAAVFYEGITDLSVARDKILINLPNVRSEIWLAQMR